MNELIKLLKDLAKLAPIAKDVGALFAPDNEYIERIGELADIYLMESNGALNLYNIKSIEMQTEARIKIIERAEGDYDLAGIFVYDGCILFGG